MKKYFILLIIIQFSVLTYGQNTKRNSDLRKVRFGLGYNLSLESIDESRAISEGFSQYGMTWFDMYGSMSFLRFFNINLGFNAMYFKDTRPFSQSVTSTNSNWGMMGGSWDEESKLWTGALYGSGGVRVPIISKLNVIGNIGYRGFTSFRHIPDCKDCDNLDAVDDRSVYVQPGIAWLMGSEDGDFVWGQFHILYSHYFNSFFNYSLTLGFNVIF